VSAPGALGFRRLHPATLLLDTAKGLRQLGRLLLPAAIFLSNPILRPEHPTRWIGALVAVVLLIAIAVVVDFLATRFALEAEALVIHSGSWKRVTRSIPYVRIQGVSTSQSVAQRMLGVGTLRVDTGAGGVAAEALLESLRWREVQQLRETLLRARDHGALAAPSVAPDAAPIATTRALTAEAAVPLAALDDEELLLAGATSMQLLVILGAAVGLVERLGDEWVSLVFSDRVRGVAAQLPTAGGAGLLLLALGVVVGLSVLAVLWLGVVLATWVRYRGFRLSRVGNALVREYGWLHRRTASTPMARVQAVTLHESPPRRMARRVEVRLKSAGGMAVQTPGDEPDVPVLLPLVRTAAANDAVAHVFPDAQVDDGGGAGAGVATRVAPQLGAHRGGAERRAGGGAGAARGAVRERGVAAPVGAAAAVGADPPGVAGARGGRLRRVPGGARGVADAHHLGGAGGQAPAGAAAAGAAAAVAAAGHGTAHHRRAGRGGRRGGSAGG
jgi:uncharacterized membrane protein YdbT with pleckstrin-like domain